MSTRGLLDRFGLIIVLLLCLLLRLVTLELTDLIDPTESRYAFVAQEMFLSGDWVTPKLPTEEGVLPYLGKPPLHFWATALCYELFGMDEWTTRLPSFLALLVMIWACHVFAETAWPGQKRGTAASILLVSSSLMFFLSGASVVDVTLAACVGGAFASFARFIVCSEEKCRNWGHSVAFFLGLGFLTKGPVSLALFLLTASIWTAVTRPPRLWHFPWRSSAGVFLLIVTPWFVACEVRNPGFIKYFFWNENLARYLVSDYGDRYGSGHLHTRGASLVMLLLGFMPWSVPLVVWPFLRRRALMTQFLSQRDPWFLFAVLWGMSPGIFFTLGRQLHAGYVVPGMPGLALATIHLIEAADASSLREVSIRFAVWTMRIAVGVGLVMIPIGVFLHSPPLNSLVSILLASLLVVGMRKVMRRGAALREVYSLTALALVLAFSIFTFQASEWTSLRRSTEDVLREISRYSSDIDPAVVAVLTRNSYSTFWHAGAWEEELVHKLTVMNLSPEHVAARVPDNIIASDGTFQKLARDVRARYRIVQKVGKWNWLRRSDLPLNQLEG